MRAILIALILMGLPMSVLAGPTQADLRQLERQIAQEKKAGEESAKKAAELSGEVRTFQRQIVELAKTVQEKEEDLMRLETRQNQMIERERELEKKLSLTDKQKVQLVTGLQTLALRPPELALLYVDTPINTIRSRMIMGYSLPVVNGLNKQLHADLAELAGLKSDIQEQIVRIKSTQSQLTEKSSQMDMLMQQKAMMQAQYQVSQKQSKERVKTLGAQAKDLKELLDKLAAEKEKAAKNLARYRDMNRPVFKQPEPPATGLFARAKGRLPYPMRGTIIERFGAESVSGAHAKGMTIKGRAGAHVIAPFDGTVLFAGPFKTYGGLVILDHGGNYLTLLAGMEQINPVVGQEVLAGEPVGQIKETKPELYLEIRKDGQAINPEPWFSL